MVSTAVPGVARFGSPFSAMDPSGVSSAIAKLTISPPTRYCQQAVMFAVQALSHQTMTFRVAQISDSHLSRDKPFFVENFNIVVHAVAATVPDLVLNTGDISLDGTSAVGDLAEGRRLHEAVGLPTRFIPGNHDVGESHGVPGSPQALISEERRERYRSHFGDDFWLMDVPGWRFIAINSQLLASDLEAAADQLNFVARAAESSAGRQLALLVHKPLFDAFPAETAVTGRFVNPVPRRQLLAAFGERGPVLVASGHVHQYRSTFSKGIRYVWGPSTGFIIPDARQPRYGEKEVGYVEHRFERDGSHASTFVRVEGLKRLNIADFAAADD
jgi:Icc protein